MLKTILEATIVLALFHAIILLVLTSIIVYAIEKNKIQ